MVMLEPVMMLELELVAMLKLVVILQVGDKW